MVIAAEEAWAKKENYSTPRLGCLQAIKRAALKKQPQIPPL